MAWRQSRYVPGCLLLAALAIGLNGITAAQELPSGMRFERDGINRVSIDCGEGTVVMYAPPRDQSESAHQSNVEWLFLTHSRRDVVAPAESIAKSARHVIAPKSERDLFLSPGEFWQTFATNRFNDYAQDTTKVIAQPLRVTRFVKGGDQVACGDLNFWVLDVPGYTTGAVAYGVELDGKRIGFVGDLVLGDGQVLDLYSFQDAIHEAKIRGYHGYGGRLASLVESLSLIQDQRFDVLIPARGPIITDPRATIERLVSRVESLMRNYLSTTALHWYFKADNMTKVGRRVTHADAEFELMPYAENSPAPEWVWAFATTRLIISSSGKALMLDCWNQSALDAVQGLLDDGTISKVDGIFVTHHHDDHTAMVQQAAKQFHCAVYCVEQYQDVLKNPGAYHLPCVSANAIESLRVKRDGDQQDWEEFRLTYHYFPGQTYYHGALHVQPNAGASVLFVGDSFAPSGFDDYCVQNRNLLHDDSGYLLCLKKLRDYGPQQWLINQHIPLVFRFSSEELDYLESRYRQRIEIQRELYFWDDPNYGVDENWASCYPYAQTVSPGEETFVELRITNHSPSDRVFEVRLNPPGDDSVRGSDDRDAKRVHLKARAIGKVKFPIVAPKDAGVHLLTFDIKSDGIDLERWTEGMVIVE